MAKMKRFDLDELNEQSLEELLGQAQKGLEALVEQQGHPEKDEFAVEDYESQAAELLEIGARKLAGNPFRVGQLVTPRLGHNIRGVGAPCVVLDVLKEPVRSNEDDDSAPVRFNDTRIGRILQAPDGTQSLVSYLGESFSYEPYKGPQKVKN
jgi:hypothetical protein